MECPRRVPSAGRPLTGPGREQDGRTNVVLLARPHPQVAPLVHGWLSGLGFEPLGFGDLADLAESPARRACGAVVSTSVTSAVHAGVAEVLRTIRASHPAIPIVLVTIARVRAMERSLGAVLGQGGPPPVVRWIGEVFPGSAGVGTPRLLPLIHRDDLLDSKRAAAAGRVVCRHFGRP